MDNLQRTEYWQNSLLVAGAASLRAHILDQLCSAQHLEVEEIIRTTGDGSSAPLRVSAAKVSLLSGNACSTAALTWPFTPQRPANSIPFGPGYRSHSPRRRPRCTHFNASHLTLINLPEGALWHGQSAPTDPTASPSPRFTATEIRGNLETRIDKVTQENSRQQLPQPDYTSGMGASYRRICNQTMLPQPVRRLLACKCEVTIR